MKNILKLRNISGIVIAVVSLLLLNGCKKFLEAPLPVNQITSSTAFSTDGNVSAVIAGNFLNLEISAQSIPGLFGADQVNAMGPTMGLYTDELQNISTNKVLAAYYTNILTPATNGTHWLYFNRMIYNSNLAIEGIIANAEKLTNKNQWLGEALFTRALLYYYTVNTFGDVPLIVTTDYSVNRTIARSPKAKIYEQIIADLKQAQSLLSTEYKDGVSITTAVRFRPNKAAATALLARVYLYTGDWANAEIQASAVIGNTTYGLVTTDKTFLAASNETIWSLATPAGAVITDYMLYNRGIPTTMATGTPSTTFGVNMALNQLLVNAFEVGDLRFNNWVKLVTVGASTKYYFPNKYKSSVLGAENIVILRLAEQYLIRAEARAQLNNISGSQADLNAVRSRAGLTGTTAASTSSLVTAITKERYVELFTEHGQRFFDLKRTGTIDAVMAVVAPLKSSTWASFRQYWPILTTDVAQNTNLTQTPGYN